MLQVALRCCYSPTWRVLLSPPYFWVQVCGGLQVHQVEEKWWQNMLRPKKLLSQKNYLLCFFLGFFFFVSQTIFPIQKGTTSITELMLNAVALNAILDVDEFLFAGFTPISIQLAVQKLEPVKMTYSRRRSQMETFGLLILLVGWLLKGKPKGWLVVFTTCF